MGTSAPGEVLCSTTKKAAKEREPILGNRRHGSSSTGEGGSATRRWRQKKAKLLFGGEDESQKKISLGKKTWGTFIKNEETVSLGKKSEKISGRKELCKPSPTGENQPLSEGKEKVLITNPAEGWWTRKNVFSRRQLAAGRGKVRKKWASNKTQNGPKEGGGGESMRRKGVL